MTINVPIPPNNFNTLSLGTIQTLTLPLFRLSKYEVNEPFFGKSSFNRFDDYMQDYGTCYVGQDLQVAIAETLLRDSLPVDGRFLIDPRQVENYFVYEFDCSKLRLLDFTDVNLKRLGGTNVLSATTDFEVTKQWSRAIFEHPERVDGFIYVSRHLNRRTACVLFDRATSRIEMIARSRLSTHNETRAAFAELGIVAV